MMGWQWHQVNHMQTIYTSLQTDKHASTSPLSFLQASRSPSCHPTNSVKALKAKSDQCGYWYHNHILRQCTA